MTVDRFEVRLSNDLVHQDLSDLLAMAGKAAAAKRSVLIVGATMTKGSVTYWLEAPSRIRVSLLAQLQVSLPGVSIRAQAVGSDERRFTRVGELRLGSKRRPLNAEAAVASALLAIADTLLEGERLEWQIMLTGLRSPRPIHSGRPPSGLHRSARQLMGLPVDRYIRDGRDRRDLEGKHRHALLGGLGTVAVRTAVPQRDRALLGLVAAALRTAETPGNRLSVRHGWQPYQQHRLAKRALPLLDWPLVLNAAEAATLLGWPTGSLASRVSADHARFLATPKLGSPGVTVG